MKKTFLFISNGFGISPVASGGEVRLDYLAKFSKKKYNVILLTTLGGKKYFSKKRYFKKIIQIDTNFENLNYKNETKLHRFLEYFFVLKNIRDEKVLKSINKYNPDYIYSSSDFFCDIIPAKVLKKKFNSKWIAMIHMRYKNPFIRPGNFFINFIGFLMQKISFNIISKHADLICVLDNYEGKKIEKELKRKNKNIKIMYVKNGIFLDEIKLVKVKKRNPYKIILFGSNRYTKGLQDLPFIAQFVNKYIKNVEFKIYGAVTGNFKKKLIKNFYKYNVSNVEFVGYKGGTERFKLMKSSGIFLSLSREESWNISLHEALACGCKIIAYDLPVYHIFKDYIFRIPKYNKTKFAKKIVDILQNKAKINTKGLDKCLKKYDWKFILKNELFNIEKKLN